MTIGLKTKPNTSAGKPFHASLPPRRCRSRATAQEQAQALHLVNAQTTALCSTLSYIHYRCHLPPPPTNSIAAILATTIRTAMSTTQPSRPPPTNPTSNPSNGDTSYFDQQRSLLVSEIAISLEQVLQNINKLNRALEGVVAVGNEFGSVEALWSRFEGVMGKEGEERDGDGDANGDGDGEEEGGGEGEGEGEEEEGGEGGDAERRREGIDER